MNAKLGIALSIAVIAIGGALVLRSLFPVTVPGAPRIVTQYDTVTVIDTAWRVRLRRDTVKVNVTERVVITIPETVFVMTPLKGITAVSVGARVGDSTLVGGFSFEPLVDSGWTKRSWQAQYYTLGPLKSLVLDTSMAAPAINFFDYPGKPCGRWCKLGHYLLGGSVGAGTTAVVCLLRK